MINIEHYIERIKNFKFNISKNNNKSEFNIINSDLENIRLTIRKSMMLNISSAKIIKKNRNIKLYSSKIKAETSLGISYFSSLSIFSDDYNNIKNSIEIKSNINTNYKFLRFIHQSLM